MITAKEPMSRVERVAAFILVALLAVHIRVTNERPTARDQRAIAAPLERAMRIDCSDFMGCLEREALLLIELERLVRDADIQGIQGVEADMRGIEAVERELVQTRGRLARLGTPAWSEYPLDIESENQSALDSRVGAMEYLSRTYARVEPTTRTKIESRSVAPHAR